MVPWLVAALPASSAAEDPAATPSAHLSSEEAASLAAKLANDACDRLYKRRPFTSAQYPIDFVGDRFRWGRLDPGGEGGFSAEVSFGPRGGDPKVKCYWSTDMDRPKAFRFIE
jgi:hypothetical protein